MESKNYVQYVLKDDNQRDFVLIFPGGGYHFTSPREAMPVAKSILESNMHAGIFWYRETHLKYPLILDEGRQVLETLRKNKKIRHLYSLGFSAGAHYALMLAIHFPEFVDKLVLAYPVISSDPMIRHEGSITNLLTDINDITMIKEVSLENHIHDKMKPIFVMHTANDQSVPIENSLRLIEALQKNHVPYEAHLYPKGRHGVSIVTHETSFTDTDIATYLSENKYLKDWFILAKKFLRRKT